MEKKKFEFLPHTADFKFKVFGTMLNEIFENTVLAISAYISPDKKIASKKGKVIEVHEKNYGSLLYKFIDEILFLIDSEGFVPAKASITMRGFNLKAEIYGDTAKNYNIKSIKAATYAEMYIKKTRSGFEAQAVLDV
ncbi:MAG: archease [archaeon]|nr:archease [archaeon]